MTSHDTVVLDVDGTLLDSNYHHTVSWASAFESVGVTVPLWRIHRHIGMGGDRLVPAVAGDEVEQRCGEAVRDAWKKEYDGLIDRTRLFDRARDLLVAIHDAGVDVALASSSIPEHAEHAFDLLDAEALTDTATTSEDAEESKPHPELVDEALSRVGGARACLVGDSVWDVEAAKRAGVPAYAVLTGGYGRAELEEAGAVAVYADVADLLDHVDDWL
ncbi:MAG TPA: HAD family hydrolase [Nocardioides sp.]|uniref:HAD family hydrolase n=1 Tax=Nocardioides sp. TaxID=35761 RepID=UPI002E30C8D1|nr:HAD family hydrolase [Nocardioides sp.]HEX5087807.1 HAD family hydrolase [Nocardioides sp.]